MNHQLKTSYLVCANVVCVAVACAIVYFAFTAWPTRYANGTLSIVVTAFFVAFVVLTIAGAVATAAYAKTSGYRALQIAVAPSVMACFGFLLGLLKHALTGDF
jgi:hypothetical protein